MSSLAANAQYIDKWSESGQPVSATLRTSGLAALSMIVMTENETSLLVVNYTLEVSHDCKNWITMRREPCGHKSQFDASFTERNRSVFGNFLHFKFLRITIDGKENTRIRLVISAR